MLLINVTSQGSSIAGGQKTRKAALFTATPPPAACSSGPTVAALAAVSVYSVCLALCTQQHQTSQGHATD